MLSKLEKVTLIHVFSLHYFQSTSFESNVCRPVRRVQSIGGMKQLLSINEKTEGCLHDVLSLKGDSGDGDARVL